MAAPRVTTTSGSLTGLSSDGVDSYLGIPYAASCAGDRRWRAPGDAPVWTGTREAAAFGPDPIQPQSPDPFRRSPGISEDCLTVNVWRPAAHGDEPLAVMVWFEGGSFMTVSGASSRIDGAALARRSVIVVTVNYRVNIFGFLAHPLLTAESEHHASSNYGLMDQIAALRWVQANIAAFGGDAKRVTVFGVSAGSASISLLLTSPLAVGLFDQAILHSPGAFRPLCTLADAEAAGSVVDGPLAAMRAMSTEKLLAYIPEIVPKVRGLTTPRILRPIHDGYVLPRQEAAAYDAGEFMHVPLIVGSTANEGGWAVGDLPVNTVAEYRAYIQQNFGAATDEALRMYPVERDADVKGRLAEVFGDTQFTYGARSVAQASSRYQPKTFRYLFRQGTAAHADDTPYVFGNLPAGATEDDRRVSELQTTAWTRFAKTGDPNGDGVPSWTQYDSKADAYLEIGPQSELRNSWRSEHLDFIDRYLRSQAPR
jgi:carboxylesterase type B